MQFIEFYITTYNSATERVIDRVLTELAEAGHVKGWKTRSDDSTIHWAVKGNWAAYSTVSAIDRARKVSEHEPISFSLEHFEDD